MSPKATLWQQIKNGFGTAAMIAGGVIAVTALVKPSLVYLDGRYVHQQEYLVQRRLDSLAVVRQQEELMRKVASVDTGVRCLRKVLPKQACEK